MVPVVVELELALEGLVAEELVAEELAEEELLAAGVGLEAGADAGEDGAVELCPPAGLVEPWPEPARGSMYCWSPADGPLASTVAGTSRAAAAAAIRQAISLRGMGSGEVLHPAQKRALAQTLRFANLFEPAATDL